MEDYQFTRLISGLTHITQYTLIKKLKDVFLSGKFNKYKLKKQTQQGILL